MTAKDLEVYKKIDEILYSDWNPIGVKDLPKDEYEEYTILIWNLKKQGAEMEKIAQTLNELTTDQMGLSGNIEHCRQVARKIVAI